MRTRIGLVSIVTLILLSGFLSSATWSKRGGTLAQGEKALAECADKANLLNIYGDKYDDGVFYVSGSEWGSDSDEPAKIFKNCMERKGYRKIK